MGTPLDSMGIEANRNGSAPVRAVVAALREFCSKYAENGDMKIFNPPPQAGWTKLLPCRGPVSWLARIWSGNLDSAWAISLSVIGCVLVTLRIREALLLWWKARPIQACKLFT